MIIIDMLIIDNETRYYLILCTNDALTFGRMVMIMNTTVRAVN